MTSRFSTTIARRAACSSISRCPTTTPATRHAMSTLPPLRALLIEDEIHARRYLRELLAGEEGVAIVGEADTGNTGAALIRTLDPDLVFLDVQMPELDGF